MREPRNVRATVLAVELSGLVTVSYPSVYSNTPDNVTTFRDDSGYIEDYSVGSMISLWLA